MTKPAIAIGKENCKKSIESIGQDLINRAEEITKDLEHVKSITIYANITPTEVVTYDVTKNYSVNFIENKEEN